MNKKTLLLFDDDKQLLEMATLVLESFGYNVAVSYTSQDVIEKVSEIKPDLILMDNWIPTIGGIEATRLLKNHPKYNCIPVIYLSANKDIEILANQAGADTYLEKPFNLVDLENLINKFLLV
ncbi:response regulator [Sphingobacterium sp. UBA5670]|uniref:response regulator n=1 Tax=Sphingobacterium sp. UBA5670 TaxID=1947502 RepID=UPI0025D4B503|nr:response regulator [Sphingobacterium sp. UBA5670]